MAAMIQSMIKNLVKFPRDRPVSHKGTLYLVGSSEGEDGGPQPGSEPNQVIPMEICHPMPPCYDEELARVLRKVCMVLSLSAPPGSQVFPILVGPTLHAWYHLGSQVPWKQRITLAVVVADVGRMQIYNAAPIPTPAQILASAAQHLVNTGVSVRQRWVGDTAVEWEVNSASPRPDRKVITVALSLEVTPLPASQVPSLAQLRRVCIDGGNSGVFVPGNKPAVMKAMEEWARRSRNPSTHLSPAALTAAARKTTAALEMPYDWMWDPGERCFVRPTFAIRAVQFPPNLTTGKGALVLVILLGLAWVIAMMLLPELGAAAENKRRATATYRRGSSNGSSV